MKTLSPTPWSAPRSLALGPLALLVLLALGAGDAQAAGKTILIEGPRLRLSDLVGPVANDADLGPAPPAGVLRRVPRGRLRALLSPRRLRRLPRFITVRTRSVRLDCKAFTRQVRAALAEALDSGLRIETVTCRGPLTLPKGPLDLTATFEGRRRAGKVFARLRLRVGQWPEQTLVVPLTVDGLISVLVTRRSLPMHRPISRAALRVEKRRASEVFADVLRADDTVEQFEPRGTLPAGTLLRKSRLAPVPVVRRGHRVTLTVLGAGVRLTGTAEVREDGTTGAMVRVICLKTRKLVKARVVGPGRVAVDL